MVFSSFSLTPEQVKFRNDRLVQNLRYKYPQVANYSDEVLIKAYNEWFAQAEDSNEDDFLEFIEVDEKGKD